MLADNRGRTWGALSGTAALSAELVTAQVKLQNDSARRLELARRLVAAKIRNYSTLATSLPMSAEKGKRLGNRLRGVLKSVSDATDIGSVLGVEGFAASIWYQSWSEFLGSGFTFKRRVSPNANDPVNVLLNIGYTLLYRLTSLTIQSTGLCSTLGILHVSNNRFQALTTDLQESFRFLVDRAVIVATHQLKPSSFRKATSGQYSTTIDRQAARLFQKLLWDTFNLGVCADGTGSPVSYLVHFSRQARALRRHLSSPLEQPFEPFTFIEQAGLEKRKGEQ